MLTTSLQYVQAIQKHKLRVIKNTLSAPEEHSEKISAERWKVRSIRQQTFRRLVH